MEKLEFDKLPCENTTAKCLGKLDHRVPLHSGRCVGYTLGNPPD
jgi:hypothetical protein